MAELPSGTVTFLFTDLQGSTRLWDEHPDAMRLALARHDEILRDGVSRHDGHVVKTTGDGIHAVFASARDAVDAAVAMQLGLAAESFAETGPLRVRMGVHTCEVEYRDGDYFGSEVNRAARLMSLAHGDQIVVSASTASLLDHSGFELRDLGEHRLEGLSRSERLWQVCAPGLAREFPPLRSTDATPGNLPRQLTSFVGRDALVAEVAARVRSQPLVTLTGVGGVGKTRLALEVAGEVACEFPHGAWLCELAPLSDPDAIWETLASALRVPRVPGRGFDELVMEFLYSKRLLLVLDNCEHLLVVVAAVVQAIAEGCADVAVLATSREGVGLSGEQIIAVPSLGVPPDGVSGDPLSQAESVVLFCDRARAVRSDFMPTSQEEALIGAVCRRLDGIPLAIELAAARVRSLTPDDILDRLDQRFKLLTRGSRAALERHQTLRNTISWSYELLDGDERRVLNRLSVFAGGCDLPATEAVLGDEELDALDVVDIVGRLVDKSLVVAETDESGRVRYRLLETVRQYAQEQLEMGSEAAATRRRHADHYVAVAEKVGAGLRSPDQLLWDRAVAPDIENLRTALDWSIEESSADHALRLVAPLTIDRVPSGESTLAWAEVAVEMPGASEHPRFVDVASWATHAAANRGDAAAAARLVAMIDTTEARSGARSASASRARFLEAMFRGDLDAARDEGEKWVARAQHDGDALEVTAAMTSLSLVQSATGNHALALQTAEEGLRVARTTGIPSALASALFLVPWSLLDVDPARALGLFDEALEVGTQIGDPFTIVAAITGRGVYFASEGDWEAALDEVRVATERIARLGVAAGLGGGTLGVAAVALTALGHFEAGTIILGASYRFAPAAFQRPEQLRAQAATTLVEHLGQARFDVLFTRGNGLGAADAISELAATLASLA